MRILFYILCIGILFFGCTKAGKNISVRGRVYNSITNEGIPNIEIKLLKEQLSLSGGNEDVKTVYTDAKGYYELDHASVGARFIGCFLDNDQYYRIGWTRDGENEGVSAVEVSKGKYTYLDYQVVPYSNSKLIINNTNCQGSSDKLVLYQSNQIKSFDGSFAWQHNGCIYWETNGYSKIPMGKVFYKWEVTKNSVTNTFYDTVFYGADEFKTYEIDY